jgi:hypothetical protein
LVITASVKNYFLLYKISTTGHITIRDRNHRIQVAHLIREELKTLLVLTLPGSGLNWTRKPVYLFESFSNPVESGLI